MQLSLQHSLVYQPAKDSGKRFPNFPVTYWCRMFRFVHCLRPRGRQRDGAGRCPNRRKAPASPFRNGDFARFRRIRRRQELFQELQPSLPANPRAGAWRRWPDGVKCRRRLRTRVPTRRRPFSRRSPLPAGGDVRVRPGRPASSCCGRRGRGPPKDALRRSVPGRTRPQRGAGPVRSRRWRRKRRRMRAP
ncbi:hypothetical protein FBY31_2707 [Arthrobacter sp. SLBN-100]|nr:hypothetical protein FBY31_2707 [Arthrobacter sp. SLBN-100]